MKKTVLFSALALIMFSQANAQETYENAKLANEDLNGTARYVGMGGAMEALGADISTISSNPAGIGLFRHSAANLSFGFVSQQDAKAFADANKTNMSFDQVGVVASLRTGARSFLNFAFNYHKSKNFDYIMSAIGTLDGNSSQNKQTYLKSQDGLFDITNRGGVFSGNSNSFSQTDYLYANATLPPATEKEGMATYLTDFYGANGYAFDRAYTGYIGEYDFNISGNINDRVYLGLTVGIHDVHYNGYSEYTENLLNGGGISIGSTILSDDRRITGTGFDIKAGIIFRPVEENPFRIGLYASTPTWYDLTTSNNTTLDNRSLDKNYRYADTFKSSESYDFKMFTPWKFGLSAGTTVGNFLAVGATYEYSDYSTIDTRINDGESYDWYYDTYYTSSSSDDEMNRHTKNALKGVSTFKLGLEYKVESNLAVRFGYNYVSPMYDTSAYKDGTLNSPGSYYSSTTDYTNWKSTNRITCGLGYTVDKFSLDLAYQYSAQNGRFHAFNDYFGDSKSSNLCDAVDVSNKRHQVLLTLGYHF